MGYAMSQGKRKNKMERNSDFAFMLFLAWIGPSPLFLMALIGINWGHAVVFWLALMYPLFRLYNHLFLHSCASTQAIE